MTAHRPAQFARHAAVVLAGAASLTLTVAAGTYIVQQIADTQHPDSRLAAPIAPVAPDAPDHRREVVFYPVLTASSSVLPPAALAPRAVEPETVQAQSDSPPTPTPLGGAVRLGDAYFGARVAKGEADTVSVTVDTNAFTVLTGFLRSGPEQPGASTVTTMRTDLDTQSGEVRLALSDPGLGEHALRLNRHGAPAATPPPAAAGKQGTTEPVRAASQGAGDSEAV
ncbi:hypothetical protein LTT66_11535 [Nocardia gipuzkoensis]|uniref:hypothetical protein n=1 Tax=Nocardia gipuzkoensis TaxID=2749991 RepID=UPI001E5D044C|nr:hypothetical protein [Nocardia gipuzkoensis]UGT70744.1 hypothetical protein LTT66_11535 [Nocardia gipuzkoensis]